MSSDLINIGRSKELHSYELGKGGCKRLASVKLGSYLKAKVDLEAEIPDARNAWGVSPGVTATGLQARLLLGLGLICEVTAHLFLNTLRIRSTSVAMRLS